MTINLDAIISMARKENKDAILKLRISSKQKNDFMKVCEDMHVDSSALVRAFIQQCIDSQQHSRQ